MWARAVLLRGCCSPRLEKGCGRSASSGRPRDPSREEAAAWLLLSGSIKPAFELQLTEVACRKGATPAQALTESNGIPRLYTTRKKWGDFLRDFSNFKKPPSKPGKGKRRGDTTPPCPGRAPYKRGSLSPPLTLPQLLPSLSGRHQALRAAPRPSAGGEAADAAPPRAARPRHGPALATLRRAERRRGAPTSEPAAKHGRGGRRGGRALCRTTGRRRCALRRSRPWGEAGKPRSAFSWCRRRGEGERPAGSGRRRPFAPSPAAALTPPSSLLQEESCRLRVPCRASRSSGGRWGRAPRPAPSSPGVRAGLWPVAYALAVSRARVGSSTARPSPGPCGGAGARQSPRWRGLLGGSTCPAP